MSLLRLLAGATQVPGIPGAAFPFRSGAWVAAGSAPQKYRDFGTARGRDVDIAHIYITKATWANMEAAATQCASFVGSEFQSGYALLLSLPPIPSDGSTTMANLAAGTYDTHITTIYTNLINAGLSQVIIRDGWEFNLKGTYYSANPTSTSTQRCTAAEYVAGIQHLVTLVRGLTGGTAFRWHWCPSSGYAGIDVATLYPGDSYVDYVGFDGYDSWFQHAPSTTTTSTTTTPQDRWLQWLDDGSHGANAQGASWHASFAATHQKPLLVGEWAESNPAFNTGGGSDDDPYFMDQFYPWCVASCTPPGAPYQGGEIYFESDTDLVNADPGSGNFRITTPWMWPKPNAQARYFTLWSGVVTPPQQPNTIDIGVFNSTAVPPSVGGVGYSDGQQAGAGATAQSSGDVTPAYVEARTKYLNAHVKWRRDFNSGLPSTYTVPGSGILAHLSVKTNDWTGLLAGTYDGNIASLARAMPAGFRLTFYHEPEDNIAAANGAGGMTWANWAKVQQRFYSTAKAANPKLLIGPIFMSYQWNSAYPDGTTDGHLAYPGDAYCDFLATDTYQMEGPAGNPSVGGSLGSATTVSITSNSGHMRFHNWAAAKNKPLGIGEWGVVQTHETTTDNGTTWSYARPSSDAQIANYLRNSVPWLVANGYVFVYLWNSYHADFDHNSPPTGTHWFRDMNITPTKSDYAKAAAEGVSPRTTPLALQAWNDMCNQYGS